MKISLYKFITTFCLVPVNDWSAFVQRITKKILTIWLFSRLFDLVKGPFFWISLVVLLTYSPDTVAWIFVKIGEIELTVMGLVLSTVMGLVLSTVMPDIFATGSEEYRNWAQIWQAGLNALPADMVSIMNGLGVAQLLGYVTATISVISTIKIFRSAMKRARLM